MSCTPKRHNYRSRLGEAGRTGFREYDSLINHFFRGEEGAAWLAPVSIWEAEDAFHIDVDAPGVAKEDVEVTFDKGTLSITLERKAPEVERTFRHNERGYGKVLRSVSLPDTVNPETLSAELTNGVLHVSVAKRPETQPRKVDVKIA
jgi:HSP20 family protein